MWSLARLFKSAHVDAYTADYTSAMSIVRDDGAERQTRVDRMIEEFRKAQSRRLARAAIVKGGDQVVELQRDVHAEAAVAGSPTTPRTSH